MDLPPICANPISCIDIKCCRRHAFYLTSDDRLEVKVCIDRNWKRFNLFRYKYEFPKKPNWCYDGNFCGDKNCIYDHILDIKGRNIVRDCCKNEIEDILIPVAK